MPGVWPTTFLVLHGECVVILDGEERPLRHSDFLHCPAGNEHVFVAAAMGRALC
jgi:quercetin dioxygenase-like cupin family protein